MNAADIKDKARRDFNNAAALMSIIPTLGFVYLLIGKSASLSAFEGNTGYSMLILLMLILLGIISGRKLLWYMINRIVDMQNELVEKERLAAMSETFISLSHEIRNPLAIMMGNLDLLTGKATKEKTLDTIQDQINTMKAMCDRVAEVMDKMSRISKPSFTTVGDNIKMLDLPSCELGGSKK